MGVAQQRARLALVCAVAVLSAACASPAEEPEADTSNAASTTSTGATESSEPGEPQVTYAVHEVDPPGQLEGARYPVDMLLVSDETIPDELVDQIEKIRVSGEKAVTATERLSIGQFSAENKSYRVAAVDPSEYWRYTGVRDIDPDVQTTWDRVAGGEIAIRLDLKDRIPLDKNGYLSVGSGETTFPVHVGAYAPQVESIDAVVNTEWGEALGLPENNALIIYTGAISPQALRKQLKNIVGHISITDLDAVARYGLDPNTFQTAVYVGTFASAVGTYNYTPIGGGRVQPEASWVRTNIVTDTVPLLGTITCNKAMMPQLKAALAEVVDRGLSDEIYQTAGCYYPRFIAGSTTLSNHSFGLAIDINTLENQRGTVGQMNRDVVAIFKYWGFAWGGDWNYTDPMHFELERIVNPG
jgi:hypothetical protein